MKFIIDNMSKSSGRLGRFVQLETEKQFKTPLLMQTTKSGSIPCLCRDVFLYVSEEPQVLQMSLATMDQMAEALTFFKGGGLSAYVGYKGYPTMMMVRDPCETMPSGSNDRDVVPLFTRRGKEMLSAERYMDMIESFAPDIYQGLSDCDTNLQSSNKRVQKSVDRTENVMDYCYERQRKSVKLKNSLLFAPIVGGFNTFARTQSIKHTKLKGGSIVGGYLLEGFHSYGITATELSTNNLVPSLVHCLKELEVEKAKMLPGAYTPIVILESIRLGVDIFDTSYAYCAAINFKALSFDYNLNLDRKSLKETPFIDVTNESLKEDFTPLLNNCKCLACTKHTRAYLQHLYKTKELLGPILLMIHNLHHTMNFFEAIRTCISKDNLSELIQLIKYQNSDEEIDYSIQEVPVTKPDKISATEKGSLLLSEKL